jgi:hypothetical protein
MIKASKCRCGALTVEIDGNDYSMSSETFNKTFPQSNSADYEVIWHNCNHCVNHWGIDLCGCGSGEPFGNCDNNMEECDRPAQNIETGVTKCYGAGGWM